jgi:hypothetical protein
MGSSPKGTNIFYSCIYCRFLFSSHLSANAPRITPLIEWVPWQAFLSLDADMSGYIDQAEFKKLLHRMNIPFTKHQFDQLWAKYDADGSGEGVRDGEI